MPLDLHESILKQYWSFRNISADVHRFTMADVDPELRMDIYESIQGPVYASVIINVHLTIKRFIIDGRR
jgi:hypothetical protein